MLRIILLECTSYNFIRQDNAYTRIGKGKDPCRDCCNPFILHRVRKLFLSENENKGFLLKCGFKLFSYSRLTLIFICTYAHTIVSQFHGGDEIISALWYQIIYLPIYLSRYLGIYLIQISICLLKNGIDYLSFYLAV